MYKKSRMVGQGSVVVLRGNRIQRCGKGQKPFGVWEDGHNRVTITLQGERVITPQPMGIVKYGVIGVKVAKTDKEEKE